VSFAGDGDMKAYDSFLYKRFVEEIEALQETVREYTPFIYSSHCNVLTTHHDIVAVIYEDE
jgi:hypothetical protein